MAGVLCHVVVIEDLDAGNPVGTDMRFAVVPRTGELVSGIGVVVDVTHYPAHRDDPAPESRIQIFVARKAKNADRT